MESTWRELIEQEMNNHGESWELVDSIAGEDGIDVKFDPGYGATEGDPFTVWTARRVYFPACYDGAEWCGSVSRNADGQVTPHVGGG